MLFCCKVSQNMNNNNNNNSNNYNDNNNTKLLFYILWCGTHKENYNFKAMFTIIDNNNNRNNNDNYVYCQVP